MFLVHEKTMIRWKGLVFGDEGHGPGRGQGAGRGAPSANAGTWSSSAADEAAGVEDVDNCVRQERVRGRESPPSNRECMEPLLVGAAALGLARSDNLRMPARRTTAAAPLRTAHAAPVHQQRHLPLHRERRTAAGCRDGDS